jgi:hypothetical protein
LRQLGSCWAATEQRSAPPVLDTREHACCPCCLPAICCPCDPSSHARSGPREDATRIGSAGVVRRQAVDISPLRRVNQAIWLLTTGAWVVGTGSVIVWGRQAGSVLVLWRACCVVVCL